MTVCGFEWPGDFYRQNGSTGQFRIAWTRGPTPSLPPLHDDEREKVDALCFVHLLGYKFAVESASEATISGNDVLEGNAIPLEVPVTLAQSVLSC